MQDLTDVSQIQIPGQSVTFERSTDSCTGWCATGWQQGLPVARKPIPEAAIRHILRQCPDAVLR
jgi:hypothetical protein